MRFPRITIYDRFIFIQVLMTSLVAILLFTIVWIAPEMLLNTIKSVLAGEFGPKTGVLILTCQLPLILSKAFPVGLLLGSLFTFDKLSKDSELTIFRAVGMSFARIIAPILVLSVIFTGLCYVTTDRLVPYAAHKMAVIKNNSILTQYIYTKKDVNKVPVQSIIVSKFYQNKMENVIVLDFSNKKYTDVHQLSNIYYAKTGVTLDNKWVLSDITRYNISSDGIFIDIDKIPTMEILQGESAKNAYTLMTYATKKEREITNHDMHNYIKLLKSEDLEEEYRYMLNKYFQRFFHPFVCILLAILGALLGFSKPREQRLVGFTIAIACIFLYYITLPFFDLLAEKGIMLPILTALFPPIAFSCAIVAFYKTKDL
ncbi:MAG: LptF/LptG family permease [Clostridiaceae bacterium]|jgi:lipopolysaccharide export system permease protein|nr:LptF/LptG family permease [Clostridiaceae bacterium]